MAASTHAVRSTESRREALSATDEATAAAGPDVVLKAAVAAVALAGLGLRLWMLSGRIGVLDSDGAVPGLMALHMPEEFPVFYWGQAYGGSIESLVAAALFVVLPDSGFVLRLVPVAFCAGSSLVCWRIGHRLIGARAGMVAGALFWLAPIGLLWWSTKVGVYWSALFLTLLALLLLVRAVDAERWSVFEAPAFGMVVGLAWWANPQSAYLLAPAGLVYGRSLLRHWRRFPLVMVGAAVGVAPWLVHNLRHDWASLDAPAQANTVPNEYLDHLHGFVTTALPMALGLRQPFTKEWVVPVLAPVLYVAAVAGFAYLAFKIVRRRDRRVVLLVAALTYPFFYALSPFSWFVGLPRYTLFLFPLVALLVASVVAARTHLVLLAFGVAAVSVGLGTMGLLETGASPGAPDAPVPVGMDGVEDLLVDNGVRHAFANYWVAYRVTFELHERVLVTAIGSSRYEPIDRAVRTDPRPAYLFVDGSSWLAGFRRELARLGVPAETHRSGPWVLVLPGRKLLPEELPAAWAV